MKINYKILKEEVSGHKSPWAYDFGEVIVKKEGQLSSSYIDWIVYNKSGKKLSPAFNTRKEAFRFVESILSR